MSKIEAGSTLNPTIDIVKNTDVLGVSFNDLIYPVRKVFFSGMK